MTVKLRLELVERGGVFRVLRPRSLGANNQNLDHHVVNDAGYVYEGIVVWTHSDMAIWI